MDRLITQTFSNVQTGIEVAATLAFALSGVMEAARKKLDAVGVTVVASVAAFGGGTLRDVLLDRRPLFWIEHSWYVWLVLGLCIAAMWLMRAKHFRPTAQSIQWPTNRLEPEQASIECRLDGRDHGHLWWRIARHRVQ
jgi:uncharacterized membrane protein YeiH